MTNELKQCIEAVGRIVAEEGIAVYFQPLVSLSSKGIVGFEAFSRGVDEEGGTLADAGCLFHESLPEKAQRSVEDLCLKKSLSAYKPIYEKYHTMLLFLNINAGLYSKDDLKDTNPLKYQDEFRYNPRMIVFEFDSDQLVKNAPLELIRKLQKDGYRISIDNSDLRKGCREHLFMVRPDFVKVDRTQYKGIEKSEKVRELFRFIVRMFRQAGVMVIAKGVETEEEAHGLLEAGICLQQGYFYSDKSDNGDNFTDKVTRINSFLRERRKATLKALQEQFSSIHLLLKNTISRLQQEESERMNEILEDVARRTPELVAAFIMNESGKQLSRLVVGRAGDRVGMRIEPTAVGSDHSYEDYFMYYNTGIDKCAGIMEFSPFCQERHRYVYGHFYRDDSRKGSILLLFYKEKQTQED